jgi:hypothetical protein
MICSILLHPVLHINEPESQFPIVVFPYTISDSIKAYVILVIIQGGFNVLQVIHEITWQTCNSMNKDGIIINLHTQNNITNVNKIPPIAVATVLFIDIYLNIVYLNCNL